MTRQDFYLTVPDMAGQSSNAQKLKFAAEEGMRRVGDGDSTFTFLCDKRGIPLVEIFQFRSVQSRRHNRAAG